MIDRIATRIVVVLVSACSFGAPSATADVAFPSPRAPRPFASPEGASLEGASPWPAPAYPACCPRPECVDPCSPRRGPIELRDAYALAQPFLTLPALSPDTLGCGRTSIRAQATWSNSFGWGQTETGESPTQRFFIVDAETRTFEVTAMHGVTDDLDVGLRLPLHWRGAGFTDEAIDLFHSAFSFLGVTSNKREDFRTDVFRIHGLHDDGSVFDDGDEKGVGLGNAEAIARWRFLDGGRDDWSWAVVGRVTLPTGTAPFDAPGVELGGQLVGAKRLSTDVDLFLGAGGVFHGETRLQGIEYEALVGHAFVAVEWRFAPRWSLIVESDYATQHAADVARFDRERWYVSFGAKFELDASTTLEGGFVENLISQQTTTDFGLHLGIEHRF